MPPRIRITIGLEQRDYDALAALAEQEQRSLSWMVAQAVKQLVAGRQEGAQFRIHFRKEANR